MSLPKSLEHHSAHERAYQKRLLLEKEKAKPYVECIEQFLKQLLKQNDFCMLAPVSALPAILKDHTFKSQMEVGNGRTLGGLDTRRNVTAALFGCDVAHMSAKEYPKYGFLCPSNHMMLYRQSDLLYHYGTVLVTFDKAKIEARTTMTIGSSLDFKEYEHKCPTKVMDPKYSCLHMDSRGHDLIQFYTHIKQGALRIDDPFSLDQVYQGAIGYENYELQFHGHLSTRDVQKIELVPLGDDRDAFASCIPELTKQGIPYEVLGF